MLSIFDNNAFYYTGMRLTPTLLLLFPFGLCAQEDHEHETIVIENEYEPYDTDLLNADFHAGRREALRELMPANSVAFIFANPVRNRSNDVDFEYHQDPDFYYLTGLTEPNAVVMILSEERKIDGVKTNEIIFVQPRDATLEMWNGPRLGVDGVTQQLGFEDAFENTQFSEFDLELSSFDNVYYFGLPEDISDDKYNKGDLYSLIQDFEFNLAQTNDEQENTSKLPEWMAQLREIKLDEEMILLRKAIDITCAAQIELMKALNPEMAEYQGEAIVEFFFKNYGAEYAGFPSIVGGGENSCILHYITNRKPLIDGDMLVVDIGAEYHGYTADVTRTMPVDGVFSEEEKAIYNLVLQAQQAGVEVCKPGNKFWLPGQKAMAVIANGLIELGIITNKTDARLYFPHGTSHYLGLDVHDAGLYGPLEAGNVITVEPGIYIPEGSDCDEKWWNIGIRIEDDVLITEDGYEVLSDCVPKTIEEIEAIMAEESIFNLLPVEDE